MASAFMLSTSITFISLNAIALILASYGSILTEVLAITSLLYTEVNQISPISMSMMMSDSNNGSGKQTLQTQDTMDGGGQSPSLSSTFAFNPEMPLTIPLVDGYYNGTRVFFIHTETSDRNMADMMTQMINFPTLYVPQLLSGIPEENMSKVYVFTNGIPGSGPYGGGPFMFQIDVFDSIPIQEEMYSQYRVPYMVTWNENVNARILTSEEAILRAEENGELTIEESEVVVNAPIIGWNGSDDKPTLLPNINNIFQSIPDFSGEVLYVNSNEYVSRIKLNPLNSTG